MYNMKTKAQFMYDIKNVIKLEYITIELLFNWDHTVCSSEKLDNGKKGIKK